MSDSLPEFSPFPPIEKETLIPPKDRPASTIKKGARVFWTDCTQLSAALVAVGCGLRHDPPYTYKLVKGKQVVHWHHVGESKPNTKGEVFKTDELFAAWKNDVEWAVKFPDHPFTMAMHAIKNLRSMTCHINNDVPFVNFRTKDGAVTISVKYGSQKHKKCEEMGLEQL